MTTRILIFLMTIGVVACSPGSSTDRDPALAKDHYSFANVEQFVTEQIVLDLNVDFEAQVLNGSAMLFMRRIDPDAREIVLDTRDLTVENVHFLVSRGKEWDEIPTEHTLGETDALLGTPLTIYVPDSLADAEHVVPVVHYRTSPESTALGWLPPELTAGGEHPMLYSQSQAIHARSWIPLQDTPAVRFTYLARVRTPPGLIALMSAENDPDVERDGDYYFEMPQPIPSYLMAIAAGNLHFAALGEDTGVYAEPELLEASAYEFADTQAMFETAEAMFGPYQWGRYDLLILPPSFPYGGMENPRLSFLTPSLLAGDRSLVSVVAHELAHSWSGNLVTNQTWRDGWLNEGWTSYLEFRLMQVIYDEDRAAEENLLNYEELLLNFERIDPKYQALAPRITELDPESGQGTIAYHKGNLFLQYLEHAYGREIFDQFITDYFSDFAFQVITTEDFVDYLDKRLLSVHHGILTREQVERWMYEPGLPDDAVLPTSRNLDDAAELAAMWSRGELDAAELPVTDWSAQATIHFINALDPDLSTEKLVEIDKALGLSDTQNAEIARTWFIQVATRRHEPAYDQMAEHLRKFGRVRLIRPIYVALAGNGSDMQLARELFNAARGAYHPIANAYIGPVFEDDPDGE